MHVFTGHTLARLFGRGGVPAPVRARLTRGERVLTHAPVAGGREEVLTATTRALYLPDGHRVPWENIDRARWGAEELSLVEEGVGEHTVALRSPEDDGGVDYRRIAATVSERVAATILVNNFVPFPSPDSTTGFRLVARRTPAGTDVDWRVHLGEDLDPDDPRLPDAVERSLSALRVQMGV